MKKSILIALGMVVMLFFYGYVLSTSGHDHRSHGKVHIEEEQGGQAEHSQEHQH